ncbi:hypothetical protein HANVADRAFT_20898 [Hanseniaspora valbyensis NRRL Y-1626]|uniref:methionine--tRNA ligase n=1 Tax=Hanseniaspora valbyensis NRRL Y-1626 TaxID=766949 RepID=A0A1B7TJ62_9ASCO|nr:hypothetical protein HANVADRAFT_20898 [Hanseniaspora valbyensis NRRL Y-1626]
MPKIHITTPIFYPNAKPHLGHFYTLALCDVQVRFNKLRYFNDSKSKIKFTTGTDEHGLKIQNAATKLQLDTQAFVNQLSLTFKDLCSKSNIQYDRFIRTTDKDHLAEVGNFWKDCKKDICTDEHKGWYSISDETFYPDNYIKEVLPDGKQISISNDIDYSTISEDRVFINTETNNQVKFFLEQNYFFKLDNYRHNLISHIEQNPDFIQPSKYSTTVLNLLKNEPLNKLSISRPSKRLNWAIPVPEDPNQSVYVWFDALCNYLTVLGSIPEIRNHASEAHQFMQNTTHVIGKDILKFHCIYWPIFLMSANLPLPKRVVVHSHWLNDGVKMSKSLGNVVNPIEHLTKYDSDSLKWAILHNSSVEQDGNFRDTYLKDTRNGVLVNKLCNLVSRSSKKFNPKIAICNWQPIFKQNDSDLKNILKELNDKNNISPVLPNSLLEIEQILGWLEKNYIKQMEAFNYQVVTTKLINLLDLANEIFQDIAPWSIKDEGDIKKKELALFLANDVARIFCIYSKPILPNITEKLFEVLLIPKKESNDLTLCKLGYGSSYGKQYKEGLKILSRVD